MAKTQPAVPSPLAHGRDQTEVAVPSPHASTQGGLTPETTNRTVGTKAQVRAAITTSSGLESSPTLNLINVPRRIFDYLHSLDQILIDNGTPSVRLQELLKYVKSGAHQPPSTNMKGSKDFKLIIRALKREISSTNKLDVKTKTSIMDILDSLEFKAPKVVPPVTNNEAKTIALKGGVNNPLADLLTQLTGIDS